MKPNTCTGCPLKGCGNDFLKPQVGKKRDLLFVGEASGKQEAISGRPFDGMAGHFLDRLLKRAGIDRADVSIANTIFCRPPNNELSGTEYEYPAIAHCRQNLSAFIQQIQPKVIVALGGVALGALTGFDEITRGRGYIFDTPYNIPCVGTFHPAYMMPRHDRAETSGVLKPWRLTSFAIFDLHTAQRIAREGFQRKPTAYIVDPSAEDFYLLVKRALGEAEDLSIDLETMRKGLFKEEDLSVPHGTQQIIRFGFSYKVGTGVSVPTTEEYMEAIRMLLASSIRKVGWNIYGFDLPLLLRESLKIGGEIHDAMWAWHIFQSDLPKGLEEVGGVYASDLNPWKHSAATALGAYNAQDCDVALRNWIGIREDLRYLSQYEIYERHVCELYPILFRAGTAGLCIDIPKQSELRADLENIEKDVRDRVQAFIPKALLPTKRSKKPPSLVGEDSSHLDIDFVPAKVKSCSICGAKGITKAVHMKGKGNPCKKGEIVLVDGVVPEYITYAPFNLMSSQQMLGYALHKGHEIPIDEISKRPTTDKHALETLVKTTKDPVYSLALEMRESKKILSTFLFIPDEEGKIYTEYTFAPSNQRLSSRNYNLQNVARQASNKWAKRVRETIIPKKGYAFVEADSAAIEAVFVGFFSGDLDYIERAKDGIHAYVACNRLGLPFVPESKHILKTQHEAVYDRIKRVIHGTNYMMTARMMRLQYPDIFQTEAEAAELQNYYLSLCPKLRPWQNATIALAAKQCFLQNPWGYRHYFYHVLTTNWAGNIIPADDAKRAVSFNPSSSAAAFMKDNAILIGNSEWAEFIPSNFLIHDSYCLEVPLAKVDAAVMFLAKILTRPIHEMNGLTVGCEVLVGRENWASMQKVHSVR